METSSVQNKSKEVEYESLPSSSPLYYQLLAGAFAGIMEHSIMFPIDVLKTRIQSTHTKLISNNLVTQITKISSAEGTLSLWRGVQSVILGAGPAHAVYFGTYEFCKSHLIDETNINTHQPLKTAISGAMATIASDALMNPFDTIKQRIQLDMNSRIWSIAKNIYRNEGLSAFYYSYPTTIAMNIPFTALNFVIYESSTRMLNPMGTYNPFIHCICGGLSGTISATITTPLDVVKTTLQVRGSETISVNVFKKVNTFDKAAKAILQTHGWRGFLRGLKPRVVATLPSTAISWTAYECAKHFLPTSYPQYI